MTAGRLALRIVVITTAVVVGIVILAVVAVQTSWGRNYLRGLAERQAGAALNANVTIGSLEGSLLSDATIRDFTIGPVGRPAVTIERVSVDYNLLPLLRGRIELDEIQVERPVVRVDALGALGLAEDSGEGPGRAFAIGEIRISNGQVQIGPEPAEVGGFRVPDVIRNLEAELAVRRDSAGTVVSVDRLSFSGDAPDVSVRHLSGKVTVAEGDLILEDINARLAESSLEFGGTIENYARLGETP